MKRRLILCTHSSLYSSRVLEVLVAAPHIELVGIVNSTRVLTAKGPPLADIRRLLQRSGLRYALHLWLATSGFELLAPGRRLKAQARRLGIPVLDIADINNADGLAFVRALGPDVCLSAYFNQIVREPLLSLPRFGCINIHPSLLPRNRGVDPLFHARLRGESEGGVTLHRLDAELDTGPVLAQQGSTLNHDQSLMAGYEQLFRIGAALAVDAIAKLDDRQSGQAQQGQGNYDGWPDRAAVAKVRGLLGLREYWRVLRNRPE
ncbi:methionyl-tRNA formyltransferase [Marinobacterium aestuariivivens]|uniref:Methionyl-tRNA formyltransferase n=1 Tax=Marinobacterium aestuariivivens TaxID=1698799 RepID=A0ABW1ZTK9_9GAMM